MNEFDLETLDRQFGDDYHLVRLLGTGTVSQVWLAREAALDRLVALKVLLPRLAGDDTTARRFDREARSGGRISHPAVASVYRVGKVDGVPFMAMEYIKGRSVADLVEAGVRFEPDEAMDALSQVAGALAAAHHEGVLHRDVRPGNVLREEGSGRFVLTDFGIAGVLESGAPVTRLTTVGEVLGTPRYLSPEQLRGQPLTPAADVYSLAVLGYEMLTGEGPFPSGDTAALVAAQLEGTPRPLDSLREDLPSGLGAFLARCLSPRPEQRPTAAEAAEAMASGEGLEAAPGPDSSLGRFLHELRRRKVYRVAVAYLAAAFVILEGAGMVLPELPLPEWSFTLLVAAAVGGFPAALVLAWSFDLTRGGIQRAESWQRTGPGRVKALAIQGVALLVSLALAVGIGWWILSGG